MLFMPDKKTIQLIANKLDLKNILDDNKSYQEQFEALAAYIEQLIQTDFNKLIAILYRIDVNEDKLRKVLDEHKNTSSGKIIAKLMIEREIEKIKWREKYRK